MTSSSAPFDQASGLREMFAAFGAAADDAPATPEPLAATEATQAIEVPTSPAAATSAPPSATAPKSSNTLSTQPTAQPSVVAMLCPARPALTLPLAQMCSRLLSEQGHRHAWIDELDFEEREQWPLPGTVRFDLGQSLANHVPLANALRPLEDPLRWYASARRLHLTAGVETASLAKRLSFSGLAFKVALVCAHPQQRSWALYADKVAPLLLCPIEPASLKLTLDWLNQQAAGSNGLDLRHAGVILLGKNSGPQDLRGEARATLQSAWQALFGHAPAWMDTADMRPDDSLTTVLPRWAPLISNVANRLIGA